MPVPAAGIERDVTNERDSGGQDSVADGSNYRESEDASPEIADGSNYRRDHEKEGSELADGSNYRVTDDPGSEIADGSSYRDGSG